MSLLGGAASAEEEGGENYCYTPAGSVAVGNYPNMLSFNYFLS